MILLAVSGGIDSMCMADMCWRHTLPVFPKGLGFAVAHCNFHLRGAESDADEELVRGWCKERGIRLYCKDFDTAGVAGTEGISIEMAARDLRYSWFKEICARDGYDAVAIAHNANDNAETLILNLLRGTGGRGLRGMSPMRPSSELQPALIRPLLGMTRAEISRYAAEHGVPFREDRSNSDTSYKRNRIRHNIFPEFEKINPSFLATFAKEMEHFSQENNIAEEYFRTAAEKVSDGATIYTDRLLGLKHWKYVLFRLLDERGFDASRLDDLISGLEEGTLQPGKTFISGKCRAVSAKGRIILEEIPASGSGAERESVTVEGLGEYMLGTRSYAVRAVKAGEIRPKQPSGRIVADAGVLKFPFRLRPWRAGDWMHPLGMRGRKKLSDLFVDLKWTLPMKENAAVIAGDDEESHVRALLCERIDGSLKIGPQTRDIIVIETKD